MRGAICVSKEWDRMMPMETSSRAIAMLTARIGLYEKTVPVSLSIPDLLAAASETGFDFIEMSIDETEARLARLAWGRAARRALVDAMHDTAGPFGSICLSGQRKYPMGSAYQAVRARSMEIMEGAIELAADPGIRIVQIAG